MGVAVRFGYSDRDTLMVRNWKQRGTIRNMRGLA